MSFFKRAFLGLTMQRKLPKSMEYGRMPAGQFLGSVFPGNEMRCLRAALRSVSPVRGARALDLLQLFGNVSEDNIFYPDEGIGSLVETLAELYKGKWRGDTDRGKSHIGQVSDGQVIGVTLADDSIINGDVVLSAIDMKELFFSLLPDKSAPRLFREKLAKIPYQIVDFVVTAETTLSPGMIEGRETIVSVLNPAVEEDALFTLDDADNVSLFIHFPKPVPESVPEGHSQVQILAPVRFIYEDNWHSGADYEKTAEYREFKKQYARILLARADAVIPGLSSHIADMTIATPVSYRSCTGNDEGAAYGWRRPRMWRQKVPYTHGLYIAGHWTYPGPGVLKSMMSGKNASRLILSGL